MTELEEYIKKKLDERTPELLDAFAVAPHQTLEGSMRIHGHRLRKGKCVYCKSTLAEVLGDVD